MILGIGKYKDRDRCLLECKEITGQPSFMIKEILDTSRLDFTHEKQDAETFDLSERLPAICEPYQLIAKAKKSTLLSAYRESALSIRQRKP